MVDWEAVAMEEAVTAAAMEVVATAAARVAVKVCCLADWAEEGPRPAPLLLWGLLHSLWSLPVAEKVSLGWTTRSLSSRRQPMLSW
jgi:hypothetical protein